MFHMIPHAVARMGNETEVYVLLVAGFSLFLGLEQFLNWHHSHTRSHNCGPFSPPHKHGLCVEAIPTAALVSSKLPAASSCARREISETHMNGLDDFARTSNATDVREEEPDQEPIPNVCTCSTSNDSAIQNQRVDEEAACTAMKDMNQHCNAAGDHHKETSDAPDIRPKTPQQKSSLGYLILIADAVHNFIGGLFVGASFVDSTKLGLTAWASAAAHEIPQELGDFAILVHAGWSHSGALTFNFISALTFPLGTIIAYVSSKSVDVSFLIPFAAGNFLYIAATDLIPEVKHCHGLKQDATNYASFLAGIGCLLAVRIVADGW